MTLQGIGLAAALAALAAAAGPAAAGDRLTVHRRPAAAPLDVPVGGGLSFRTPFQVVEAGGGRALVRIPHYQGPDGAYDTPADLARAIEGTPCGQSCTARALARWGYAPAD